MTLTPISPKMENIRLSLPTYSLPPKFFLYPTLAIGPLGLGPHPLKLTTILFLLSLLYVLWFLILSIKGVSILTTNKKLVLLHPRAKRNFPFQGICFLAAFVLGAPPYTMLGAEPIHEADKKIRGRFPKFLTQHCIGEGAITGALENRS